MERRKQIVLVEDNPDDELLTLRALGKNGLPNDVTVLRDGEEALEYFLGTGRYAGRNVYELPRVALLDLNLPKIDGLGVLKKLREFEATKDLPVVILTSSKEERDLSESYQLGANSYVWKPVDFAAFTESVRQLGLYWLSLNEIPPKKIGA